MLGFYDMTVKEVAESTGLSVEEARLAKAREYDEAFLILDNSRSQLLLTAIEQAGMRWTRGGRFYHVCGDNDKGQAVRQLVSLYRQSYGSIRSIGLGDGLNDADFLRVVDVPVVIRSAYLNDLMRLVPNCFVPDREGVAGWNEAVIALLNGRAE